jgi:hypothetical protein
MVRLAALLLAFGLVHSAEAQPVQPPEAAKARPAATRKPAVAKGIAVPAATGPCIGVIPVIGDHFGVKKVGLTVFGNEFKEIDVDNWGLDDLAAQRVQAALGGKMVARRIAYAKGAFDRYRAYSGPLHPSDEKSADMVRQAAGTMSCQRYVVITNTSSAMAGNNQSIYGFGIAQAVLGKPFLHALVYITVHDGRTFAVLKHGRASLNGDNFWTGGQATQTLDDSWWPEPPEAANTPRMREAARKLLGELLDKSLPEMLAP